MKKRIRRLLLSERGDSSYISRMYPRMHLIFMYYCVIILTIRVTGTDMNKNSCKAAVKHDLSCGFVNGVERFGTEVFIL